MKAVEIVTTAIITIAELIVKLARTLEKTESERFDATVARAEVQRIIEDVKLDEAIERRVFERERAERNGAQ